MRFTIILATLVTVVAANPVAVPSREMSSREAFPEAEIGGVNFDVRLG